MALKEKYKELVDTAYHSGINNLQVREQDGVLYIDGEASGTVKQQLWDIYEKIDPDYSSGDLMLNIDSGAGVAEGSKLKITTANSNLNIRSGPGTTETIVGKAARGELVTLVKKHNDQWWVVRTEQGEEGFAFTQYLAPV